MQGFFNQFAIQGQTFFQASGDFGAYVTGDPWFTVQSPMNIITNLTAVGGTELVTTSAGGSWSSESTWNNPLEKAASTTTPVIPNYAGASGGGICSGPPFTPSSTPLPLPTYQLPFINSQNKGSSSYRNVPDVSAVADYFFVAYGNGLTSGGCGTSYASPLWAGFMALVNQQLATSGNKGPVGFVNPTLYTLAASPTPYYNDFHDIADGSNNNYWHPTTTPIYPAVTGYDLATGLGSIKCNLLNDVVTQVPTWTPTFTLTPTPLPTCQGAQPGNAWTPVATGTPTPINGSGGQAAVFDPQDGSGPRIWSINGTSVYSSFNGSTWTLVTSTAPFPARTGFGLVAFNNKLWLIGGTGSSGAMNDVWWYNTASGWNKATGSAAFSGRSTFGLLAYNGDMWVIGGNGGGAPLGDVWYSQDGVNWTESNTLAFPQRSGPSCYVFNNQMWVIGGANFGGGHANPLDDVWASTDGKTWTEINNSPSFSARDGAIGVVCGNAMWLIGGANNTSTLYDVWVSLDGNVWKQTNTSLPFNASMGTGVSYNGEVWAFGFGTSPWVWSSNCCLVPTPTPSFTPTMLPACNPTQPGNAWTAIITSTPTPVFGTGGNGVVFDPLDGGGPRMWAVNGTSVYSSFNGLTWTLVKSSAPFPARNGFGLVSFNNRLWLIGGLNGSAYNDVWWSSNGTVWNEATASAAFSGRTAFGLLAYNGYMWVLGGNNGGAPLGDVWYSADGITWTESNSSAFPTRASPNCYVFNNRM